MQRSANANAGYKVFDASGNEVYPNKVTSNQRVDTLHTKFYQEIRNGSDRVNRLEQQDMIMMQCKQSK